MSPILKSRFNYLYIFLSLIFLAQFIEVLTKKNDYKQLAYSEFLELLEDNKFSEVTVDGREIEGILKEPDGDDISVLRSNIVDLSLAKYLESYDVKFSQSKDQSLADGVLGWLVPLVIFLLLWGFGIRLLFSKNGANSGFMSVGKSRAKIYVESNTKVSFADVAGAEEAKFELFELVDFLKNPDRYKKLGSRMPKGVLLVGPPGTGKTLIAKAVAGEANVPFFSTNGAEFVEMFVGVGAARVRDLFQQAKQKAPCIIFIDEIDALGKARMAAQGVHGNDEKEQTLNQLLAELDGFNSAIGIVLLAATNRPEILDPALLRSGRFDRQVLVDKPDRRGRLEILKLHGRKTRLSEENSLEKIAGLTSGFTGADLENLVNEASLIATRKDAQTVCEQDFIEAMERIVAGLERKNRLINEFERRVVAYHEMGHVIVAHALNRSETVQKVSIIPRGVGALGYTIQRPTDDRYLMTKDELLHKMAVLMGGRVAEQIVFKHRSTGAADDLAKVSDIARNMVCKYGMSEELADVVFDHERSSFLAPGPSMQGANRTHSEEMAKKIDEQVSQLVAQAKKMAFDTLTSYLSLLEESAQELLEHESLAEAQLRPLLEQIERS